jgi:hypothetical protein
VLERVDFVLSFRFRLIPAFSWCETRTTPGTAQAGQVRRLEVMDIPDIANSIFPLDGVDAVIHSISPSQGFKHPAADLGHE